MTEISDAAIDAEILEFLKINKVASVCCSSGNRPYCFSCFYSILEDDGYLIFKSAENTKHIQIATENNHLAGTIISPEISMTKVQGIQFEGILASPERVGARVTRSYYLRFPFAVAVPGKLWVIELQSLKYTSTINGVKHRKEWGLMVNG